MRKLILAAIFLCILLSIIIMLSPNAYIVASCLPPFQGETWDMIPYSYFNIGLAGDIVWFEDVLILCINFIALICNSLLFFQWIFNKLSKISFMFLIVGLSASILSLPTSTADGYPNCFPIISAITALCIVVLLLIHVFSGKLDKSICFLILFGIFSSFFSLFMSHIITIPGAIITGLYLLTIIFYIIYIRHLEKYIVVIFSSLMFCFVLSTIGCASSVSKISDIDFFINDEFQKITVYRNDNFFQSDKNEYIPLQACMEALGCTFERKNLTEIIVTTPDNRIINMRIGESTITYTGGIRNVNRVPLEYLEIDGVIYYPLYEVPELIDCEILYDENKIYLDTGEYLKKSHSNSNIGRKVNINVYVNDIQIQTIVYSNRNNPPVQGPDNVSDYVQLKPILEVLGINLSATVEWHYLTSDPIDIDGEIYVPFSAIRYNINGSLKQDDYNSMYLYSADYERLDIPATLEEAYEALDEYLELEDIEYIKNLSEDEVGLLHYSLGMWIRNNWLYTTNSKLADLLYKSGVHHPDNMSGVILSGYRHYLNGEEYTSDMYKQEAQQVNIKNTIRYLGLFLVFIQAAVVIYRWKKKTI